MPLVNIYFKDKGKEELQKIVPDLKKYLADKLSSTELVLAPSEISIRFLEVKGGEMIANVEVEIAAHSFPDRVKKQDEICLDVMNYVKEKTGIADVKVWLQLSELGHSW